MLFSFVSDYMDTGRPLFELTHPIINRSQWHNYQEGTFIIFMLDKVCK